MSKNLKIFLMGILILGILMFWGAMTIHLIETEGTWPGLIMSGLVLAFIGFLGYAYVNREE